MNKALELKSFYHGKKVLITGHTGFKGSWLCALLLHMGANVTGYALSPDTKPSLYQTLQLNNYVQNIVGDIRNITRVKKTIQAVKPQIIFHLAAQPLVRKSYEDPLYTFETNGMGTAILLEAIRGTKVKAVVLVTTDKVYDMSQENRIYKETDKLGGHDPYSSSKAVAELIIESYRKSFFNTNSYGSLHTTLIASARAGNVIGGGDWQAERLIPDAIRAFYQTKKKLLIRNPNAIRPWQFVLEPLYGYMLLAKQLHNGVKKYATSWNFGPASEDFIPVHKLVKNITKILGRGTYPVKKDTIKHEAQILKLNSDKAHKLLRWKSTTTLASGLKYTLDWYNDFYRRNDIHKTTIEQIRTFLKTK